MPAALRDRLERVRRGEEVLIRYTGLQTTKAGRLFKAFDVFVAGEETNGESGPTTTLALIQHRTDPR
jgi:hypothetical protein